MSCGSVESVIKDYFGGIDSVVDGMVSKIVEEHKIDDEDDIAYLGAKIMHDILKFG